MLKPKKLKPGSRIAIISPSSGLPHVYPDIYELGLKNLREILGFEIVEMPTARMPSDELYNHPELRAKDINDAFKDERIDGIITSIGGYESIRILPFLDVETILNNPKFIMGFSDASTFLTYFNQLGMITFYGPGVMAGIAQMKHLPLEFTNHLKEFLFFDKAPYSYTPYKKWTNGYKDWSNLETLGECEDFHPNDTGWTFLQGSSLVEGNLWGGCIEVLEFMKSTRYWPHENFWYDKIIFFETSEEKPTPAQVGYMLRNYGMQGIFQKIKGIIFGRAKDYSDEENQLLFDTIVSIVKKEFGADHILIIVNMDFGHTDPKFIIPLGVKVRLDSQTNEITLLEKRFE